MYINLNQKEKNLISFIFILQFLHVLEMDHIFVFYINSVVKQMVMEELKLNQVPNILLLFSIVEQVHNLVEINLIDYLNLMVK